MKGKNQAIMTKKNKYFEYCIVKPVVVSLPASSPTQGFSIKTSHAPLQIYLPKF